MRYAVAMAAAFVGSASVAHSQSIQVFQEDAVNSGQFVSLGVITPVETDESIIDLYAWQPPGQGASYNGAIMRPNQSEAGLWFHRNTLTGDLSFVVLLDENTTPGGGSADTTVTLLGTSGQATFLVQDDLGPQFSDDYPFVGPMIFSAEQGWGAQRSDGYAVGPIDGDWSLTFVFDAMNGLVGLSAGDMATTVQLANEVGRAVRFAPIADNDECVSATPLSAGVSAAYDLGIATPSSSVPLSSAPGCGPPSLANDVWFRWTALADGRVSVTSQDSSLISGEDLRLFRGPCSALQLAGCEVGGLFFSRADALVVAGESIWIRVADDGMAPTTGTVEVAFFPGAVNDDCELAAVVGQGATAYGNDTATDSQVTMSCGFNGDPGSERDRWFSYTASASCSLTIDTAGSAFDTILEVYEGTCDALTSVVCNDDVGPGDLQSSVTFAATAGTTYLVQAGSFDGQTGSGVLNVTENESGLGTLVCAGTPNSTGDPSWLCVTGSVAAA